jgi:acetylornithine/N-succinyldiaminopimelate aminotransferase
MTKDQIVEMHQRYVMPTYAPSLVLVRGEGSTVWDADGREYLDFLAGIAVVNVGHCHPGVTAAIREQAGKLVHVSNLYYNETQPRLAQALSERSTGGKCFFCNSGAEANEGLIKLARLHGRPRGRYEVVTMRNSFHGRTLATLTATGQDKVKKGFDPLPAGFALADLNDLDSVRAACTERTAAVLVEAVQGEGGIVPTDHAFLRDLRAFCDERGMLLLFDEVQCGLGRTGAWFGFQQSGVKPDAFSMAKGLGNGFPIGAVVASPEIADTFQPGHHATTFGGNPLGCAAALAVIEAIESEGLLDNAQRIGAMMIEGMCDLAARYEFIESVRGVGLMLGLVCDRPAKPLEQALCREGLITLATAERVIRMLPPLNVSEAEAARALEILDRGCRAWQESFNKGE